MDQPAAEEDRVADGVPQPMQLAQYVEQVRGFKLLAWVLMLSMIGIYARAALSSRDALSSSQMYGALRHDVLVQFGGRPNWSTALELYSTAPLIHRDLLSLILALLWMLGLARRAEGRLGALGMLAVFVLSSLAGGLATHAWGPHWLIDAGSWGGVAGLVGHGLGWGLRHFRRLPSQVATGSISQFFWLAGLVVLMHFVFQAYAGVGYLPWDMLGGVLAGITLGVFLPPRLPECGELGTAARRGLGLACLGLLGFGQVHLATRQPDEIQQIARRELVEWNAPELGLTFGVDPDWPVEQPDEYRLLIDGGRIFVFTRRRSPFDSLTWESTRQLKMYREGLPRSQPNTRMYVGEQLERRIVGVDGVERVCSQTTVGYDSRDIQHYEIWFTFLGEERLVILIYRLEPDDAFDAEWVEESIRHFRFNEGD